jgi:hypothetical protein
VPRQGHRAGQLSGAVLRTAFISGASDNPGVDQVVEQLHLLGYQTSIDPLRPGDPKSRDKALHKISECDVFIPIISRASVGSVSGSREFDWAEQLTKPVLPVIVEPPAKPLPPRFMTDQIIDYSHPAQRDQSTLADALASLAPAPPLPDPLPHPPAAPPSTAARKRIWVSAAAMLAVAVVAGIVMWLIGLFP